MKNQIRKLFVLLFSSIILTSCQSSSEKHIHNYEDIMVLKEPTCAEKGVILQQCFDCNEQHYKLVPELGHIFNDNWSSNSKEHWHIAVCGHDTVSDKQEHTFILKETIGSQEYYQCSVCEYSKVVETHECKHICPYCGGCLDPLCTNAVCSFKCNNSCSGSLGEEFRDRYAQKFAEGKYVITACGYEGISQIENWITALGHKKVSNTNAMGKSSGQYVSHKLVDLSTIPDDYVILLGVAYTGKGLKDGGTTKEKEIQRSIEIAGLPNDIIVFATVGASNRGTVCDELLSNILPNCTVCIVKENTNTDYFFSKAKAKYNFGLVIGETAIKMKSGLEYLGFHN